MSKFVRDWTYVVDYNNGNLVIIKTLAPKDVFDVFITISKKNEVSPYEKLLALLVCNHYEYEILVDTYDLPFYEI